MMAAVRFSYACWVRLLWALVSLTLIGCAEQEPQDDARPATKAAPTQSTTSDPPQAMPARPAGRPFEPPYPDRHELFAPPDPAQVSQQRTPLSVALRGFVEFEGRCVLLEIDGKVNVLRAGQECQGIEVISIDPPGVTLQSGGHRWTAQLMSL
jgi:hypothetical protein